MNNVGLSQVTITQNGGAAAYAAGRFSQGLSTAGGKNWKINTITLGTKASFAWWSKTTVNGKMPWVLECNASNYLNFYENNIYTLNIGDGNNNPFQTPSNANINVLHDGVWHHFAVTFDGTNALLYIDGAYAGKSKTYRSPVCTNRILKLAGDFKGGHSYDWNGMLNDFRVYDNCLTENDIKELYWGKTLEFTPQWKDASSTFDASGINYPLTPHNLTISGNLAQFNGSSTYVEFSGLHLSGGSVSIWFSQPSKPNVQRILYCDPTSKMIIGYLGGGTILTESQGTSRASYQSTGITWGSLNHMLVTWNSAYTPTGIWVNGVAPATGASSNWTNGGEIASIGRRVGTGNADYLSGSVNEVKVFTSQLTAADAQYLYSKGPCKTTWVATEDVLDTVFESGATWLKVLHHNNPKAGMFTSTNCVNNNDPDRWSKLYLFEDPNMFKRPDGTYEFMVKEKLESTGSLWTGRWTQTSNPRTDGQATGFVRIVPTSGYGNLTVGIGHSGNAWFNRSNGNWWCATGCYTFHQSGIPGYSGVVLSGYQDFYVRIDGTNFAKGLAV